MFLDLLRRATREKKERGKKKKGGKIFKPTLPLLLHYNIITVISVEVPKDLEAFSIIVKHP